MPLTVPMSEMPGQPGLPVPKMLTVEVTVEHFLDAGEQDANGDGDYFYEGDLFTFSADTNSHGAILKARSTATQRRGRRSSSNA